ncbi:MAG: citrate (Si)-synthase [Chlamydiales bacterium]|nr:citrate (Si)-synthase [Chlamydiales bacterium]
MKEDLLFEIGKEDLETGLRGIPVGYCVTSTVHPQNGLYYVDYPVAEVAHWEPERVIYLLLHGKDPSEGELAAFKKDLHKRSSCPEKTLDAVALLPRAGHPMALFSAAILILGMHVLTGDYREDCLNLIAKLPELTAAVINHHAGWGKTPPSRPELGYMENFAEMVLAPEKSATLTRVFKIFNILHYDHGGGNLSAFVGKAVASGLEDMYGSIAAAMNALAGPRHGRANQECLHFVKDILSEVGEEATEEEVEQAIRGRLERKELIYGFGHAVLRVEDPRATVQYRLAEKLFGENPLVKIAFLIRRAGTKVLQENPKVACPYPNVDAISGSLLTAAGFPYPDYYTVLFGLSRAVGISIQIVYERCEARGGKGTPIIRPKYLFKNRQ